MSLVYLGRWAVRGVFVVILTAASNSMADNGPSIAGPEVTAREGSLARPRTYLSLHGRVTDFPAERLRADLEAALGAQVEMRDAETTSPGAPYISVTYHPETRELAVSITVPGRANTTRVVVAPETLEDVVSVAVLLASELARDAKLAQPALDAPATAATVPTPKPEASPTSRELKADGAASSHDAVEREEHTIATASLFYPLATNYAAPGVRTHLAFNALYGRVGGIDGLGIGLVNYAGVSGRGIQIGGLGNRVGGSFEGLQIGGGLNSAGQLWGMQIAFGINHTKHASIGGKLAGLANITGGRLSGPSVTLGLNSAQAAEGLLVAGLTNVTRGNVIGLEVAPFNYAHDVAGVQIGIVNVAKHVSGVQLGLVNIADEVDGVPLGFISVTRSGGVHALFWASSASLGNVGIKFATRYTYTLLHVSANPVDERWRMGPGLAFGASAPLLPKLAFEPDVGVTHLIGKTSCCTTGPMGAVERSRDETLFRLRSALRYEFVKHLSLFAGVGVFGRLTYPLRDGDTKYSLGAGGEGFGGVEL